MAGIESMAGMGGTGVVRPVDRHSSPSSMVGRLNEKHLHLALKGWYARPGDRLEARVGRYVVDILRGELVIEIQTRHVTALKRKIASLVEHHDVLLVIPVAVRTSIVRLSEEGVPVSSRRSPKRGAVIDVFDELVSIPELIGHPRFALEVALTHEEEVRRADPKRGWRRHGWVVDHRRLLEVESRVRVDSVHGLLALVPEGLEEPFTTAGLAGALGRPRRLGQRMAYCLTKAGAITPIGRGRDGLRYVRIDV